MTTCPVCQTTFDAQTAPAGMCPHCLLMGGIDEEDLRTSPRDSNWTPPTLEQLQALLKDYEVLGFIARGGMGAVYKARQPVLDRIVAVKVLPVIRDELGVDFVTRFRNEARLMARMNHPGIVHVYDFGELEGGMCFFVMEFVEGHGRGADGEEQWQARARARSQHHGGRLRGAALCA